MLVDSGFDGLEQTETDFRNANLDKMETDVIEMDHFNVNNSVSQMGTDELGSQNAEDTRRIKYSRKP